MTELRLVDNAPFEPFLPILDGPWNQTVWQIERPPRFEIGGGSTCAIASCERPAGTVGGELPHPRDVLCVGHQRRLQKSTSITRLTEFIHEQMTASPIRAPRGRPGARPFLPVEFNRVSRRLAHEMRYVTSIKVNRNQWRDPDYVVSVLRAILAIGERFGTGSLLEFPDLLRTDQVVSTALGDGLGPKHLKNLRFALPPLIAMLERATSDPWQSDTWHPIDLGLSTTPSASTQSIYWTTVTIPWLREGLKELTRDFLQNGTRAFQTVKRYTSTAASFCRFVSDQMESISPEEMSRPILLDWIAWLRDQSDTPLNMNEPAVLNMLLMDMSERDLVPGLPSKRFLFRGDSPTKRILQPKPFPSDILERIDELMADATQFPADVHLMMRMFRANGPRASEVLTMPTDVVSFDPERGYTLAYYMSKTDSWRRIPLPPLLGEALVEQRKRVEEKYGSDCPYLFPYTGPGERTNPLARSRLSVSPWPYSKFSDLIWKIYQRAGILISSQTGETLTGAHLHRFRHSIATGLLNEGWSAYEVQKFLGHSSPTMGQAYAEIHDDTLRQKYEEYLDHAVGIDGQLQAPLDAEQVGVERLRAAMVRATLPNGYCTLPEKQNCDYLPSPCLSCVFFKTTPTFLPIHIRQRDDSLRELSLARDEGRGRAVQAQEQTVARLTVIIDGLEAQDTASIA